MVAPGLVSLEVRHARSASDERQMGTANRQIAGSPEAVGALKSHRAREQGRDAIGVLPTTSVKGNPTSHTAPALIGWLRADWPIGDATPIASCSKPWDRRPRKTSRSFPAWGILPGVRFCRRTTG
jgi:hypothetical protein